MKKQVKVVKKEEDQRLEIVPVENKVSQRNEGRIGDFPKFAAVFAPKTA